MFLFFSFAEELAEKKIRSKPRLKVITVSTSNLHPGTEKEGLFISSESFVRNESGFLHSLNLYFERLYIVSVLGDPALER